MFLLAFSGGLLAQGVTRVMPLGDSITHGMGAGPSQIPGGYRDSLATLYANTGYSFLFVGSHQGNPSPSLTSTGQTSHEGHTGWRIDQIQSSINNWQASSTPDVVLLHIGTNDILQNTNLGTGGNDTSLAIGRLTTLINTMYGNNSELAVVLSTLIPIQDARDEFVKNYNAALASNVIPFFTNQGRTISLVDNYANFINEDTSWNTTIFADYAHPNAAGYSAMATTFATVALPVVVPPEVNEQVLNQQIGTGPTGLDDALAVNLVQSGQSTLDQMTAPTGALSETFPITGLNDGSASGNSNYTYYTPNAMPITVTFDLDTTVNTNGYDISSVQVLSGWGDHYLGAQRFQVLISSDDGPFANFGTYENNSFTDGDDAAYLSTLTGESGLIATGVTAVRFVLLNPDPTNGETSVGASQAGSSGGTLIRELQVFGTPSDAFGPIIVNNHSFEADSLDPGTSGFDHTDWVQVSGSNGTGSPGAGEFSDPMPDGVNYAWFNAANDTLGQTVGAVAANTTYTLTVATGWRLDQSEGDYPIYPGYGIELWADGAMVASDYHDDLGNSGPSAGAWKDVTASFTTGAVVSGNLEIRLQGYGIQTNYDNVRLASGTLPTPNDFNSYISDPTFGLAVADQDFADDSDNDGLENGLEAWFGTHPGQFNSGLADVSTTGLTTTFTHPQNASAPDDLTGYYQWSPNLSDWYLSGDGPSGGPVITFVPVTTGSTTTVTAAASTSEGTERVFFRAGVSQN